MFVGCGTYALTYVWLTGALHRFRLDFQETSLAAVSFAMERVADYSALHIDTTSIAPEPQAQPHMQAPPQQLLPAFTPTITPVAADAHHYHDFSAEPLDASLPVAATSTTTTTTTTTSYTAAADTAADSTTIGTTMDISSANAAHFASFLATMNPDSNVRPENDSMPLL